MNASNTTPKECLQCGVELIMLGKSGFCCEDCRTAFNKEREKEVEAEKHGFKICIGCQEQYIDSDAHDFENYCSAQCEAEALQEIAEHRVEAEREEQDLKDLLDISEIGEITGDEKDFETERQVDELKLGEI